MSNDPANAPHSSATRTVVVTGASRGLGEAIAHEFFSLGDNVVLASRHIDACRDAVARVGGSSPRLLAAAVDVREKGSIADLLDLAEEEFGPVDVLVNNAALSVRRSFWEIQAEEWDEVLAVNLRGVFFGCQLGGERMMKRGSGRIINHASLAGQQGGLVMGAHYAASKAGIIAVTKIAAGELAPHGVTVNAVAPAAIESPLLDSLGQEATAELAQRIPVRRVGRAEEVASLFAFLASDAAGYITGATYDINGGLFMR